MRQRDINYLHDILVSSEILLTHVRNKSSDEFMNDIGCQDAVIRRIEIIGEAARRISEKTRETHPQLPWRDMIGMRNFLIHEYDDIDVRIIWDTVRNNIPALVHEIKKIFESET